MFSGVADIFLVLGGPASDVRVEVPLYDTLLTQETWVKANYLSLRKKLDFFDLNFRIFEIWFAEVEAREPTRRFHPSFSLCGSKEGGLKLRLNR